MVSQCSEHASGILHKLQNIRIKYRSEENIIGVYLNMKSMYYINMRDSKEIKSIILKYNYINSREI